METVVATTRHLSLLSQMDPIQALTHYFFMIPQSTPASSKYALPCRFSRLHPVYIPLLLYVPHAPPTGLPE